MPGGGARSPSRPYPAQTFTPPVPALTLAEPALVPSETVVPSDTGAGADAGTPGRRWHEAEPVPGDVDDGRLGSGSADASVEAPGNDDGEGSDGRPGTDVGVGGVEALGNEGAPPDGVSEPDAGAVAPPPDPLADCDPPKVPTVPTSVELDPAAPGCAPPAASPADPAPGEESASGVGNGGNDVSGNDGSAAVGRDWALAGVTAVLAPSPPTSAPPTAKAIAPSATANGRRCRRTTRRSDAAAACGPAAPFFVVA